VKAVFVTQQVDPDHPTLGAATAMVRALADRCDEVVVLASSAALHSLPPNVRFRSFAAPAQALRGARYESALVRELVRGRPSFLLAHMSPIYAVLAAPILRPLSVPLLLWFTQQQGGPSLTRAAGVVDAILSVDVRSVPISSPKVRAIGHGIETDLFTCAPSSTQPRLRLLSLGRYSEVKGHDVALRALRLLLDDGVDAELTVHGEEPTNDVRARLEQLVAKLGLTEHASLGDATPRSEVPALLGRTDVLVNATRGASADKVVFEALAACVPVVAASPVFDELLPAGSRFAEGDAAGLAAAIRAAAALPDEERRRLRAHVEAHHSVGHWAEAVMEAARYGASARRGAGAVERDGLENH
jgi:glycosyltransferase involved in cell wall biosynthesis